MTVLRECGGCGEYVSEYWYKEYCNVDCVPEGVDIPRSFLLANLVKIDKARCKNLLNEKERADLLAFIREQPSGVPYDGGVIHLMAQREHLPPRLAIAGASKEAEQKVVIELRSGDIIENLVVMLTESERAFNLLVEKVREMKEGETEKIAIHCPTEELWDAVLEKVGAPKSAIGWNNQKEKSYIGLIKGRSVGRCVKWDFNTCAHLIVFGKDQLVAYQKQGSTYKVISAEEFLKSKNAGESYKGAE